MENKQNKGGGLNKTKAYLCLYSCYRFYLYFRKLLGFCLSTDTAAPVHSLHLPRMTVAILPSCTGIQRTGISVPHIRRGSHDLQYRRDQQTRGLSWLPG